MITSDLERKIDTEYKRLLKFYTMGDKSFFEGVKDAKNIKSIAALDNDSVSIVTPNNSEILVRFSDNCKKSFREEAVKNVLNDMYGSPKFKDDVERIKRDGKLELLEQLTEYVLKEYNDFAKLCDNTDNRTIKDMYFGCKHAFIIMTTRLRCETEGLLKEGAQNEHGNRV